MNLTSKALLCAGLAFAAQNAFSQVVINEVSTNSDDIEVFGHKCDWIELYNPTPGYAYMHGFYISDDPQKPQKWQFPDNYKLEPYGYLMVLCNGEASGVNTNFKLSAEGETIILSDATGNIVDQVVVPPLLPDQSLGRFPDGERTWGVFAKPTPNDKNSNSEARTMTPKVDIKGGFFNSSIDVTISCDDPDAEIRYSINGTLPASNPSPNPFTFRISNTKVLRVAALNPDLKLSDAVTNTYFIKNRPCDLPIVSLATAPDNFFNDTRGIYVQGTAGKTGNCMDYPANWNQDWERPIHFEYFDKDHKQVVSLDAGVKIFGSCSRTNAMKSLRIIARKDEYGEKRIKYKFFANKDIDEFKSIVLRNGGNDFAYIMIRDGIITQLCSKYMDVDIQEFQPAAVYLNGEYLGMHNIREKISEHYIEENYGLKDEDIDLLENNAEIIEGNNAAYENLIYDIINKSLQNQKEFDNIASQMDINNYTDYIIAQLYIDNEDWPNNNIKYWRTHGQNSKWRWILFGTEYSLGLYGKGPNDNSIKRVFVDSDNALGNSYWSTVLMRGLVKNENYKNMFLQRFAYHIQKTFSEKNFNRITDSIHDIVYNEWKYHSAKYYPDNNQSSFDKSVNQLKYWNERRGIAIWNHIIDVFGLEGLVNVKATTDNPNAKIVFDGYENKEDISCSYFKGIPLKLSALLPKGTIIDKWIVKEGENTKEYNTDILEITPMNETEITLITKNEEPMEICEIKVSNDLEFVELYNNSENSCDISGYKIQGNISFEFATGTVIPGNGYVVVSDKAVQASNNQLFTEGKINTQGKLELINPKGIKTDWVNYSFGSGTWPAMPQNGSVYLKSYGSDNNEGENWIASQVATPGQQTRLESAKGIVINEVCTKNAGIIADEYNQYPAYIEIRNISNNTIDIAGLYIGYENNYYTIPYNQPSLTKLNVGVSVVFFTDGESDKGLFHTNFKLNNKGGKIQLIQVVQGVSEKIDEITYPKLGKNQSYGRVPDQKKLAVFATASPYGENVGTTIVDPRLYTVPKSNIATPVNNEFENKNFTISVYPNPAQNSLTIKGTSENPTWTIFTLGGIMIKSGEGVDVDVKDLKSGYYLIKICNGTTTETHKLMKI